MTWDPEMQFWYPKEHLIQLKAEEAEKQCLSLAEHHFIKNFITEQYRKLTSAEFAREWEAEKDSDLAELKRLFSKAVDSEIGKAEARARERLSQKDYSTYEEMVKKITVEVLKKLKDNS